MVRYAGEQLFEQANSNNNKQVFGSIIYNVKAYGAKGDGVTNDSSSIQSTIDAAMANVGGTVFFPPGLYRCEQTLTVDRSANANRVSLTGSGSGATTLKYFGTGTLIDFIGSDSLVNDDYLSFQTISGMYLLKGVSAGSSIGISLYKMALISLNDLRIEAFDTGLYMVGVEHSRFEELSFRWNQKGIHALSTNLALLTGPNNLSFYSCHIGSNAEYGAYFEFPTTVNFIGGSIENNGLNAGITGSTSNWGIKFRNPGYQGGVACNLVGVYIESNAGAADVWCENTAFDITDNSTVYSIVGCTFNKGTSSWYTSNNIRSTFAIETQAEKQKLSVVNCSFKAFNTYVPDAARKTILYDGIPQDANNFEQVGNIFGIDLEKPSYHRIQHQHISATKTTNQSIPNNTWTKWLLDTTANILDFSELDVANNQILLPVPGIYSVFFTVAFAVNVTGNRGLRIKKGTQIQACSMNIAQEQEHSVSAGVIVAGTNVPLTVEVFQSSGGALDLLGSSIAYSMVIVTKIADMP